MTYRSDIQLLVEIGRLRDALTRSEENEANYRKAFEFLLKEPGFAPLHVKLRAYLKQRDQT